MKTLAVWLALTCLVASGLCDASPEGKLNKIEHYINCVTHLECAETKALEGEAHVRSRRGMVSPIFIPVLIPFGIGRPGYQAGDTIWQVFCLYLLISTFSSHPGMQCFACEGRDQELCVVNPAASSRLVTCQPNQYCSVVRKEFTPSKSLQNLPKKPFQTLIKKSFSDTTAMSDANAGRGYVFISRGCRPADYVQVMAYDEKSGVYNTKSYIQFCASDFCNSGDGRIIGLHRSIFDRIS